MYLVKTITRLALVINLKSTILRIYHSQSSNQSEVYSSNIYHSQSNGLIYILGQLKLHHKLIHIHDQSIKQMDQNSSKQNNKKISSKHFLSWLNRVRLWTNTTTNVFPSFSSHEYSITSPRNIAVGVCSLDLPPSRKIRLQAKTNDDEH